MFLCLYGLHIISPYLLQTELFSRMRDQEDIPKEDVSNVQSVLERAAPLQIDAEAVRELMQKVHAMMQKAFLFGDATILKNIFRLNSLLRVGSPLFFVLL